MSNLPPLKKLEEELSAGLSLYWSKAVDLLQGSGVELRVPQSFTLEDNLFSALFLYSYFRAGIPARRRTLYAAVNQCLRGMVTGCDNLLDDEYKKTLDTDLPVQGTRFRSVLDIMASDRVLFELLLDSHEAGDLTSEQVRAASGASLRALVRSGAQEASEEAGISERLPPRAILESVHHYKTGLLFQCPWAVPATIEIVAPVAQSQLMDALYRIGLGCQLLDDMVDLAADLRKGRHNYLASLICHSPDPVERTRLEEWLRGPADPAADAELLLHYPRARSEGEKSARELLSLGLTALFADEHRGFVAPAVSLLIRRIGADRFLRAS